LLLVSVRQRSDGRDPAIPIANILTADKINDFTERNSWHGPESIGLPRD
jgi:hypothetical protein